MALLWMDGFDHFANINSAAATSSALETAGYSTTTTGADGLRVVAGRVPDSFAIRLMHTSGGASATLRRTFETDADVVTIGFSYMATERSNIIDIEGTPLVLEWPVGCKLNGVEGEAIPIRNIWYYYELVINKPSQIVQLYINNRLDITAPLPAEFANMTTYTIRWGKDVIATPGLYLSQLIDDIVLIDNTGSQINSRLGPVEITTRFPTEDVTTEWEPSVEGPLFEMVNNRPPIAGQYIQANISGKEATFLSDKPLPTDAPIFAIGVVARALKTDIDRRALGLIWGEGDQRLEVVDDTLSTDNAYSYAFFEAPAAGQTWSKEIVENAPFGVKVRP